jgi:hypothetical protein
MSLSKNINIHAKTNMLNENDISDETHEIVHRLLMEFTSDGGEDTKDDNDDNDETKTECSNMFKPKRILNDSMKLYRQDDDGKIYEISQLFYFYLCQMCDETIIEFLKKYPHKIDWTGFCRNSHPKVVEYIFQNLDKIQWSGLSLNNNNEVIELLAENEDKIDWIMISLNEGDSYTLDKIYKRNINNICWRNINANPGNSAMRLLKKNMDKLMISDLSLNYHPDAVVILEQTYRDEIRHSDHHHNNTILWENLCENKGAIRLIRQIIEEEPNSRKIIWRNLCLNSDAIDLIEYEIERDNHSENIDWYNLFKNSRAMHLVEKYFDKIMSCSESRLTGGSEGNDSLWIALAQNKNAGDFIITRLLTKLDYKYMLEEREDFLKFKDELTEWVFHPFRLENMYHKYYKYAGYSYREMLSGMHDLYGSTYIYDEEIKLHDIIIME